jgi:hypothetical protein
MAHDLNKAIQEQIAGTSTNASVMHAMSSTNGAKFNGVVIH